MVGRAALVGVLLAMVVCGRAAAVTDTGSWADAAADPRIAFPVYAPAQPLGLRASVTRASCDVSGNGDFQVVGTYGKRGSRASVELREASPDRCGDPGESLTVTRARVKGRSVGVNVFCHRGGCRGGATLAQGYKYGFLMFLNEPGKVMVEVEAGHVRLPALLRLANSLRPITRAKGPWPPIAADDFLSPDGRIWCLIGTAADDHAWCVTRDPQRSGQVTRDGTVTTCAAPDTCTQNWNDEAPRLHAGQASALGPYSCTATTTASITCTVKATGHGFTIDDSSVTDVPQATASASARTTYFFASPFDQLPGRYVTRPRTLPIFVDGRWTLTGLRWTRWGARSTRATGTSVSSDAASGRVVKTRARVTLSDPGPFAGRTVYRCIAVAVPRPASFGPRRCLRRTGTTAYFG